MSVEGLRAWIGEVERKLAKRTRVFLALSVIAIGIAGASVYLAIDARNNSVSEGDVQELQRELEAQIDESATTGVPPAAAPVEPIEPAPEGAPEETQPKFEQNGGKGGGSSGGGADGTGTGGASPGGAGAAVPGGAADQAKIQKLLEQAKKQNAEAEAEEAEK